MSVESTIVLIGVNSEVSQILGLYLDRKYKIEIIIRDFDIKTLDLFENIVMFIMDTEQFLISIEDSVLKIKSHPLYQNIPLLGMAHRQHYGKIQFEHRNLFEDIILAPINYEDILTRIDVWINTYHHLRKSLVTPEIISIHGN